MPEKLSLFYSEINQPFTVPLLALEMYSNLTEKAESDEEFMEALLETIVVACKVEHPEEKDLLYLLEAFSEAAKEQAAQASQSTQSAPKKSFGTSFAAYLQGLSPVSLLGAMTNYDIPKMRELYCNCDYRQVRDLMKAYTEGAIEKNLVAYEAALYAAGGSYKDDSKNVIDANSKEGMAMLSQFGIGDVSPDMLGQLGIDLPAPK